MHTLFTSLVKSHIAFICSLVLTICCSAQNRVLKGRVVDKSGHPIPYASIKFKGFSYGTKTDKNGNYRAVISSNYDSIVCTHVNYKRISEKIEGNNIVNLILEKETPSPTTILIDTILNNRPASSFENPENEKDPNDKYFTKVEIWASFPGGEKAFQKYLKTKIIDSIPSNFPLVKGVVKCGFTISTDGSLKDLILLKGIENIVDAYVMRILSTMPKWIPALQNGPAVEQYREVEISFNIH